MSFGSQKLVHTDGTMHHLGIDAVTPRVILVPDPQEVPLYAALLEGPVQQGCYREYATWQGTWRGEPLTVMSCGFGCMPMAIAVEELHHLGAESLIKIAACPAIQPELEPGTLLAASGAVRGEGATREYIDRPIPPWRICPARRAAELRRTRCRPVPQSRLHLARDAVGPRRPGAHCPLGRAWRQCAGRRDERPVRAGIHSRHACGLAGLSCRKLCNRCSRPDGRTGP